MASQQVLLLRSKPTTTNEEVMRIIKWLAVVAVLLASTVGFSTAYAMRTFTHATAGQPK